MIERAGSYVCINDVMIPAANIQVENVPGMLRHPDGTEAWYGIYFEILFDHGMHWVVTQGFDQENLDTITIEHYYADGRSEGISTLANWEFFLVLYNAEVKAGV